MNTYNHGFISKITSDRLICLVNLSLYLYVPTKKNAMPRDCRDAGKNLQYESTEGRNSEGEAGNRDWLPVMCRVESDRFLNLSGANTARADFDLFNNAVLDGAHGPQIGLPCAARFAMRVADIVAGGCCFSANVTFVRHDLCLRPLRRSGKWDPPHTNKRL